MAGVDENRPVQHAREDGQRPDAAFDLLEGHPVVQDSTTAARVPADSPLSRPRTRPTASLPKSNVSVWASVPDALNIRRHGRIAPRRGDGEARRESRRATA